MAPLLIPAETLLSDPDWYLHRVDPARGEAVFLQTDRQRLKQTLFLDGRSDFASGGEARLALADLKVPQSEPPRFIMHMSFCGSTQLAHLLDAGGAGLSLKEPQALVDLADWQRSLVEHGIDEPGFGATLRSVVALLSRRWEGAPPTLLKPSNWANNLLPDFLGLPEVRVLLLTIEARPFLRAVFRGGRDRLAYTARAASHLAAATGQSGYVHEAVIESGEPVDQACRLALVTHELQRRLFADAAAHGFQRLDFEEILSAPADALERAATALDLTLAGTAESAVRQRSAHDSKNTGLPFSRAQQDQENSEVERHHGLRFDNAIKWAEQAFCG